MPALRADRWRSAKDLLQLPHLEVTTFTAVIQAGIAIQEISFIGFSAPLARSTDRLSRDRLRYLSHAKSIVAIDYYRFAPGNYLAFQKELDWFLHLAIEFDDGSAGQFQHFAQCELALPETKGHI
jgi:hypothetical protein